MQTDSLRDAIVKLITERENNPLTATEIADALELRGKDLKHLRKHLHDLIQGGELVPMKRNRYGLGAPADLLTGVLSVARSGNAYLVVPASGQDVFIPQAELGTGLPGDRVIVRLDSDPAAAAAGARRTAKVIRVLERARHDVVGTLRAANRFLYVVPVDPSYKQDFIVPAANGANPGDRVVARFLGWANKHVSPEAEIVEVLGPADNPSIDTISVIRHYGLRDRFPPVVLREAETVSNLVNQPGPRLDLRQRLIVTIDPLRARDYDDALSLETDPAGNRVLGVHIADVSHFVRIGSALDREALERGNSVYLPDCVLPMLPEQLSNGVCSLKPDEDRLAFSAFLTLDDAGNVTARRFAKTIIRSRQRLTYEEAFAALENRPPPEGRPGANPGPVRQLLEALHHLAQQMRRRRFARHALDLDMPECEITLAPDGSVLGFLTVVNDASHQLVEECMVAANEAVASELRDRGIPLISRLHEPPAPEKLDELRITLQSMGYKPGDLHVRRELANFLRSVQDDPLASTVRMAVLRSMSRAVYSAAGSGHFGLAKTAYAHFTSPIRRYPDLTLHRQLAALLEAGAVQPYPKARLNELGAHCSQTEWNADDSERALIEIKKYRFLEQELARRRPRDYEALVVKVINFGMFVELVELQVQGLVHASAMSDQFVRFNREKNTLHAGKETYGVGRRVRVQVAAVDFDNRRIDLVFADGPHAGGRGRPRPTAPAAPRLRD